MPKQGVTGGIKGARRNGVCRKTLRFSSGRVAIKQGEPVLIEDGFAKLRYVWDETGANILFTFQNETRMREYVQITKEGECSKKKAAS